LGRELVVIVSGAGAACVIVKFRALDAAPPGFITVTEAVPALVRSVAGIAAVSWVAPTKVVLRFVPFQSTTEPFTKLLPVTVSVKAGPPAAALLGERELNVGAGAACVIVKFRALDAAPPGFTTVTEAVPALVRSVAGIAAVSRVAPTKVVLRFVPFQSTTEPFTKLLPVTVSVKASPPATVLLGESVANVGAAGPLPTWTIFATDGTPLPLRMKSR
jgi:hypothetical protein